MQQLLTQRHSTVARRGANRPARHGGARRRSAAVLFGLLAAVALQGTSTVPANAQPAVPSVVTASATACDLTATVASATGYALPPSCGGPAAPTSAMLQRMAVGAGQSVPDGMVGHVAGATGLG